MGEHHKESPSHYNAWLHCCWWEGTNKQSNEASAGTHNHAELQKGIEFINYEPDTYVARWACEWIHSESVMPGTLFAEKRLEGTLDVVAGVFGTADAVWKDMNGCRHYADLKTFSDGTDDYTMQLKGYVVLDIDKDDWDADEKVYIHILHGGICKVETVETTLGDCVSDVSTLLGKVRGGKCDRHLCKYCQYCSHIKECPMSNNAVQVVNGNGAVDFSKMSLPQKLVVCDTVKKLIKTLEEDAKEEARQNGGVLEADGIRYEIKTRAGKGKVQDLCELAACIRNPMIATKDGGRIEANGIDGETLLSLCDLSKTALVEAMKEANSERKDIKKKDIELYCASFYDKGDPVEYLSRVK